MHVGFHYAWLSNQNVLNPDSEYRNMNAGNSPPDWSLPIYSWIFRLDID